jgi:hypothetical protein
MSQKSARVTKAPTRKRPIVVWDVPDALKKKFKMKCLERNVSMRQVILKFMEEYANH